MMVMMMTMVSLASAWIGFHGVRGESAYRFGTRGCCMGLGKVFAKEKAKCNVFNSALIKILLLSKIVMFHTMPK